MWCRLADISVTNPPLSLFPSNWDRPELPPTVVSLYKTRPKMARRPPARAVVPYWASAAAALPAAVGEAEGVDEESEEEPLVEEGELLAEAEPELPALPALVASVVVRLPQRLSRAWMHWNWAASSEPVAAMHWSYQTRHMRPGTVCWYSLITLVMEVPFRHSHPNWRV